MLRGLVRRLGVYPDVLEAIVRGLLSVALALFAVMFGAGVVVMSAAPPTMALGLTVAVVNGVASLLLLVDADALARSMDEPPGTDPNEVLES